MSHWWCCCAACPYGGPPDCLDRTKGTVTWFTHEADGCTGEITRVDHEGPCYTVYVDSLSGNQNETGDGTEVNPWRNLNSVFNKNVAKSGTSDPLSSGVLTPGGSPDGWTTNRFVDRTITLAATDATVSGSSASLSSGVLTPSPAPTGWITDRLIGETATINGTAYTITANTTSTLTLADSPDDGTYDWTLNVSTEFSCTVTANTTTTLTVDAPLFDSSSCDWTLYVFDDDCIYNICTTAGCPKVKVLVKGTIDYTVGPGLGNYNRKLVIEPWGGGRIAVTDDDTTNGIAITNCQGCVFKHIDATSTAIFAVSSDGSFSASAYGFSGCSYSTFDDCTGSGTATCTAAEFQYYSGFASASGFSSCSYSTFDDCTGSATSTAGSTSTGQAPLTGSASAYGFSGCSCSTFGTCTSNGTSTGIIGASGCSYGFRSCGYSTFDSCDATSAATAPGSGYAFSRGCGFSDCSYSTFKVCIGSGTGTCTVYGYNGSRGCGFSDCSYSTFDACTGSGMGTVSHSYYYSYGYGFFVCLYSTFDSCDGVGNVTGVGCRRACGFWGNCSLFYNCTTSDRICEDCSEAVCAAWVCDVLDDHLLHYEETIEGVLKLKAEHSILDIRETVEGVLTLEAEHSILDIRETIEGVLTLEVTHSFV